MDKRFSLKDIARITGFSPTTVSFVLNGKARQMRISKAVEKKILEVVQKTGYVPNPVAVSLRTGRSKVLGLIVESISGSLFSSFAKVIENEAGAYGYKILYCSTENNTRRGKGWIKTLSELQIDGYIITPTLGMEKDIRKLIHNHKPVVLIDSFFPGTKIPYVLTDNTKGVMKGMRHLYEKSYKKIGFVTADLKLIQMRLREQAFIDYMRKENLFDENLLLKLPYGCEKEETINRISTFIKNTKGLEAVFFATNYLGLMGLESITRLKLKIPDKLGVICFDDHDIFRLYPPGITVIQQPAVKIAETAIRLLMNHLGVTQYPLENKQVVFPGELVIRKSTG